MDMKKYTEHCFDCGVCIEDYDHHCVFFSKCIGGGNIIPFWGTMGMLIVNFICIAITVAIDASTNNDYQRRMKDHQLPSQIGEVTDNIPEFTDPDAEVLTTAIPLN